MSMTQSIPSSGAGVLPGTRRLAVNAAFMKDIKDDNRELKQLLDQLTPMTSHPEVASNHWPEITQLLANLCDQLALHFSLEEAYGYFDHAIETEPQLSQRAETLRGEHVGLFEEARHLAEQVVEVSRQEIEPIAKFLIKIKTFRLSFERHEEAELKLILDALNDDIGVGD